LVSTDWVHLMTRRRSAYRISGMAVLLIGCLVLSGVIYDELNGSSRDVPSDRTPRAVANPPPVSGVEGFALPPAQFFAEIAQRPLFAPTRRPAEDRQKNLGQLATFSLDGVMISPQGKAAIVLHGTPPALAHVTEGQEIEGWTVSSIFADRIVLQNGGSEHELKLKDKVVRQPPVPSPPRRNF
jgi:hypothetical protein